MAAGGPAGRLPPGGSALASGRLCDGGLRRRFCDRLRSILRRHGLLWFTRCGLSALCIGLGLSLFCVRLGLVGFDLNLSLLQAPTRPTPPRPDRRRAPSRLTPLDLDLNLLLGQVGAVVRAGQLVLRCRFHNCIFVIHRAMPLPARRALAFARRCDSSGQIRP